MIKIPMMIIVAMMIGIGVLRAEEVSLPIIAQIESSGNPNAVNGKCIGLYQISPILLKEYNQFHPSGEISLPSLYHPFHNEKVAAWYLNVRIPQMLKAYHKPVTIENKIICFNAGVKYVRYDLPLPIETRNYLAKYSQLSNPKR